MELTIGVVFILVMVLLMFLGVPISFSMGAAGTAGLFFVAGTGPALMQASVVAWKEVTGFTLVCIPLFILMGNIVFYSGIAGDMFRVAYAWFGNKPGGLGIASIMGCALFGAVTGSSVAAAATMGAIALPQMKKYNYQDRLATGCLAAAGTLGILIPPSVTFVFYAVLTETSIGALFIAGIIPGIVTALLYSTIVYARCRINPRLGPPGLRVSWIARFKSLKGVTAALSLFIVVLGGIYMGIFTPTEAAGAGAAGACVVGLIGRKLKLKGYMEALQETGKVSAMIFAIIIGGILFSRFLVLTGVTEMLVGSIVNLNVNRYLIVLMLIPIYMLLGMFLDVFGMIILTIPIVYPVIVKLGFDPIWFGVFIVIMSEVALITPPVGANVFVIKGIAKEVPIEEIFRGIMPMLAGNMICILLLVFFPQIALWLPQTMLGFK